MNRRGFLAKCIGAAVAMAVAPLEPLLPRAVNEEARRLSLEQWIEYDVVTLRAVRWRLRAWADLVVENGHHRVAAAVPYHSWVKTTVIHEAPVIEG